MMTIPKKLALALPDSILSRMFPQNLYKRLPKASVTLPCDWCDKHIIIGEAYLYSNLEAVHLLCPHAGTEDLTRTLWMEAVRHGETFHSYVGDSRRFNMDSF